MGNNVLSLRNFDKLFNLLIDLTGQEPELSAPAIAQRLEELQRTMPEARELRITSDSVKQQWRNHRGRNNFLRTMRLRKQYAIPLAEMPALVCGL